METVVTIYNGAPSPATKLVQRVYPPSETIRVDVDNDRPNYAGALERYPDATVVVKFRQADGQEPERTYSLAEWVGGVAEVEDVTVSEEVPNPDSGPGEPVIMTVTRVEKRETGRKVPPSLPDPLPDTRTESERTPAWEKERKDTAVGPAADADLF